MKALSVKQPQAYLITCGEKTVELRSWATDYRGKLLIVSSLSGDRTIVEDGGEYFEMPTGSTCAVVDLVDCRLATKDDAELAACHPDLIDGQYAWVFESAVDVKPVKVKGKLRLFDVDDGIVEPVGEQNYFELCEKVEKPKPKDKHVLLA